MCNGRSGRKIPPTEYTLVSFPPFDARLGTVPSKLRSDPTPHCFGNARHESRLNPDITSITIAEREGKGAVELCNFLMH